MDSLYAEFMLLKEKCISVGEWQDEKKREVLYYKSVSLQSDLCL